MDKAASRKMGRPRGFDKEAALDAALRVFWEKSYEGATLAELTEAMGINRSSMYAAFGDKEALFRLVMARYGEKQMSYFSEALAAPTAEAVIKALLTKTAEFLTTPGNPWRVSRLQARWPAARRPIRYGKR